MPISTSSPSTSREFRTFTAGALRCSSAVRNELLRNVFPQLRKICAERRLDLLDRDMRWGVAEAQLHGRPVVPVCLDEITMRQPVVLVIVGDSGGLQGSSGTLSDSARFPWLRSTISEEQGTAELELVESLVDNQLTDGAVYWYVQGTARTTANANGDRAAARWERLQERIQRRCTSVRYFEDAPALGAQMLNDCLFELEQHYQIPETASLINEERGAHASFAKSRRDVYEPVGDYIQRLHEIAGPDDGEGRLTLLSGGVGCGKSTLLACWAQEYTLRHPDAVVVEYYVGAASRRPSWTDVLRYVLAEIRVQGKVAEAVPIGDAELRSAFHLWPAFCAPRQVVIVIDGLDRLDSESQDLAWLHSDALLPNVRLVVSAADTHRKNTRQAYAEAYALARDTVEVQPLTTDDRWKILRGYLARGNRRLSDAQLRALARTPVASTPLFIRSIVEALPVGTPLKDLGPRIRDYLESSSLEDLFGKILTGLESEKGYTGRLVENVVTAIWASRDGLSEAELLSITHAREDRLHVLLDRLGSFLLKRNGLLRFFHDQFADAVFNKYLSERGKQKRGHVRLAEYFKKEAMSERKVRELPWQYEQTQSRKDLNRCMTTVSMIRALSGAEHRNDLLRYWRAIAPAADLAEIYHRAILTHDPALSLEDRIHCHQSLGDAFNDAAMYVEAEAVLGHVLRNPPDGGEPILRTHLLLSRTYQERGNFDDAELLLKAVVEAERNNPDGLLLEALECLGRLYYARHEYDAAQPVLSQALALCSRRFGNESPIGIGILSTMAAVAHARGYYRGAEHLLGTLLNVAHRVHGEFHPTTSSALSNLAAALRELGRVPEAIELVRSALEIDTKLFGPRHPQTALKLNNLATLLRLGGQLGEAEKCLLEAGSILRAFHGDMHPDVASCRNNLATLYSNIPERYSDAEREFIEVLRVRGIQFGDEAVITINTELNLAWLLAKCGRFDESLEIYQRVLPRKERALGCDHPKTLQSLQNYQRVIAAASGGAALEGGDA